MPTRQEFIKIPGVQAKLEQIASDNGFSVDDLLTVMENESKFDTKAKNPNSTATGLIQFMSATSKDLGIDHGSLINMNELEQLDVVAKYFKRNHKKGTHPYITVALPVATRFKPNENITADSLVEKGIYPTIKIAEEKLKNWKDKNPVWVDQSNDSLSYNSIVAYGGVTHGNKADNRAKQQLMKDAGMDVSVDGVWGAKSRSAWLKYSTADEEELKQAEKDQIAIDIKPTPAPLPEDAPNVLSQIEVDKNNAKQRKLEEEERKNKISQPKELIPLADLSEEEIDALTDKQREEYGLQPTVEVVGKKEEEVIEEVVEEEVIEEEVKTTGLKIESEQPDITKDMVESIDEKSTEKVKVEESVVEEQELEKIKVLETEEMEVLDANGNIKKITVPRVQPIAPKEEDVAEEKVVEEEIVEEKPTLTKPKIRDFKNSSDYVKARMKYYKSIEDEEGLANDDELSDEEIKESVDAEQNSKVIDASKRNIFKTNGKSNIFNSIIGDIGKIAGGIQRELNQFNKSLNNRD